MKYVWHYETPIGKIRIAETNGVISHLLFGDEELKGFELNETAVIKAAVKELFGYFDGKRTEFTCPVCLQGTEFQKAVWEALKTIPFGETRSYKDIAVQIGNPKAMRAVGMANHNNPVSIIVPCHRVVGADGSLTGYGGGLPIKQYLLDLEKAHG